MHLGTKLLEQLSSLLEIHGHILVVFDFRNTCDFSVLLNLFKEKLHLLLVQKFFHLESLNQHLSSHLKALFPIISFSLPNTNRAGCGESVRIN